jgi:predicted nucleic acid-binding protein
MGESDYLIDTNVALYYFGRLLSLKSEAFLDEVFSSVYSISIINRIELLGYKGINDLEQKALNSFIKNADLIWINESIVLKTIEIRQQYSIKLPDAVIAASCLDGDFCLITNNVKDFSRIKGLKTLQVEFNS